jgi:eukaryotic-like serine/threonine-protein kinase
MPARLDFLGRTVLDEDLEPEIIIEPAVDDLEIQTIEMGAIHEIEVLGDYVLVKHLARGAMCEVWLGLQMFLGELIRPVIIKRVDPELAADPEFRKKFLREAAIMDRVRSAAIAPIYEVGMDSDSFFIASAFVQGESVADIISAAVRKREKIPEMIAARIAADVLAGLHSIHTLVNAKQKNINAGHYDLSSQTILVSFDGRVQLSDTGIGKAAEGFSREMRWFSPYKARYKSPEQARGQRATPKSDLYAIGVLLFEMVTGSISPVAPSEEERREILDELCPALDRGIRAIILTALAADPGQRFRSATDMKTVLEGSIRQMSKRPFANDRLDEYMLSQFKFRQTELRIMLHQASQKAAAALKLSVRRAEKQALDLSDYATVLDDSSASWSYP